MDASKKPGRPVEWLSLPFDGEEKVKQYREICKNVKAKRESLRRNIAISEGKGAELDTFQPTQEMLKRHLTKDGVGWWNGVRLHEESATATKAVIEYSLELLEGDFLGD